jgi:hypothetical protein
MSLAFRNAASMLAFNHRYSAGKPIETLGPSE